jgi:hypothetical protein
MAMLPDWLDAGYGHNIPFPKKASVHGFPAAADLEDRRRLT